MTAVDSQKPLLYTIGYSVLSLERCIELLHQHGVTAVADVRSSPFSARKPEFNREPFSRALEVAGIVYVYLGDVLGARFPDPSVYVGEVADFGRIGEHVVYREGIERLRRGMERYIVALVCAEKDPITCHRAILICRSLRERADIRHILADGSLESHPALERRLRKLHEPAQCLLPGLGPPRGDPLDEAYAQQGQQIAWRRDDSDDWREDAAWTT